MLDGIHLVHPILAAFSRRGFFLGDRPGFAGPIFRRGVLPPRVDTALTPSPHGYTLPLPELET
jgi:hypothetical protein